MIWGGKKLLKSSVDKSWADKKLLYYFLLSIWFWLFMHSWASANIFSFKLVIITCHNDFLKMNVSFRTQISTLGIFSNIICNTEWWMTFHYISIVFYHMFVCPKELKYWATSVCGEPLNMSIMYSTTMILMMYSPLEKSKYFHDLFFFFRILKER